MLCVGFGSQQERDYKEEEAPVAVARGVEFGGGKWWREELLAPRFSGDGPSCGPPPCAFCKLGPHYANII